MTHGLKLVTNFNLDERELQKTEKEKKKTPRNRKRNKKVTMEGTPNHLKLPTRARHWTRLFQDTVLKGHLSTQSIIYTYSPGRYWTVVNHTGEAAGLNSFPTVSTLSEKRMLSALPKSGTSQSFSSHHLLGKKRTKKQKTQLHISAASSSWELSFSCWQ